MVYLASEMEGVFRVREVGAVYGKGEAPHPGPGDDRDSCEDRDPNQSRDGRRHGGAPRARDSSESRDLSDSGEPLDPLDPQDDCDALEDLEEEIVVLAARIHAATYRLLTLIADFDRRRGWELGGHRSCAHWLHYRTGIDLGAAREKVRAARVLEDLPQTSDAMSRGELSFSKVRALTRVADADNEGELLELARGCTTAQLEKIIRAYRIGSRATEAELERRRHESRRFSVFPGDDGMYVVNGRLDPEVGALLIRAVEAASDALYRDADGPWLPEAERSKKAAQLRADAVGLVAERAMAAGFGGGEDGAAGVEAGNGCGASAPLSGTRAERYQVVLHVEEETLREAVTLKEEAMLKEGTLTGEAAPSAAPPSHLEDGTRVSAETSRRLSCDASVVTIEHGEGGASCPGGVPGQGSASGPGGVPDAGRVPGPRGSILNVGRRTRTIHPSLRRALETRDRGCRFPGCGLRFTDAHHVKHWADGGETSLSNTLLLCRHHHRLVHEGGWQVKWQDNGHPAFLDPRGGFHFDGRWDGRLKFGDGKLRLQEGDRNGNGKASDRGALDGSAETSPGLAANPGGLRPDAWTGSAKWKREADIPPDVFFPAIEAIGEAGG